MHRCRFCGSSDVKPVSINNTAAKAAVKTDGMECGKCGRFLADRVARTLRDRKGLEFDHGHDDKKDI